MALGGGTFTNYNKTLPGTYINFVSAMSASGEVSDRGVCAVAMELDWGTENEIFTVSSEEFMKDSLKLFGYVYTHTKLGGLRDLFMNASVVHVYRLGEGVKASCDYAVAKHGGVCGNDIQVKISKNIDDDTYFDVATYYKSAKRDLQKVKSIAELTDNDFAVWDKTKEITVGTFNLTGGANPTITGGDYQKFLDLCESVKFNVLAVATTDESVNSLVAAYTKRMREERGIKFQSVLYKCAADDIGVINVDTDGGTKSADKPCLVWFVAGASAGCAINKSLTNKVYKGAFTPTTSKYTQADLEEGIKSGKFMFHSVGGEKRVLADINSLKTTTFETGEVFKENQTVRIVDQIALDDAKLFTEKYLGVVPNDEAGRISLWNDITEHRKTLVKMRAIENFKDEDVTVEKGNSKTSVVVTSKICPINSMTQLYISTTIE